MTDVPSRADVVLASAAAGTAPARAGPATLDRLAATIDGLKASLSAIRQDLEAMRGAPPPGDAASVAELCGSAATDEPASLRLRLATAETEAARAQGDRAALVGRIAELEAEVKRARTREVVAALAERPPGPPTETTATVEPDAGPERGLVLNVAQPLRPVGAVPSAGAVDTEHAGDGLQLRADLALAQLRIAELTAALQAARARQEASQAEVSALRSLTDARIKGLMGWR